MLILTVDPVTSMSPSVRFSGGLGGEGSLHTNKPRIKLLKSNEKSYRYYKLFFSIQCTSFEAERFRRHRGSTAAMHVDGCHPIFVPETWCHVLNTYRMVSGLQMFQMCSGYITV